MVCDMASLPNHPTMGPSKARSLQDWVVPEALASPFWRSVASVSSRRQKVGASTSSNPKSQTEGLDPPHVVTLYPQGYVSVSRSVSSQAHDPMI